MTDLDLYTGLPKAPALPIDPTGGRLVAWATAAHAAHQLAQSLSKTAFVPRSFQGNAADATAAIILGDELGLSPLSALRSIYMISGTPALYARTMVALAMSQGHEVWTESSTDREVVVCGRRRGSEHVERVSWTIERARKAGYTNNKKYDSDPQAMLYAKAAAEVARKIAPDVLSGVPFSVEDLELEDQPTQRVGRSAARVSRAKPEPPEPELDEAPAQESVAEEPAAEPEPITPKQLTALNAAMTNDLDLRNRDEKLKYLSEQLGRDVASSKEITRDEASTLLDRIKSWSEPADEPLPEPDLEAGQ